MPSFLSPRATLGGLCTTILSLSLGACADSGEASPPAPEPAAEVAGDSPLPQASDQQAPLVDGSDPSNDYLKAVADVGGKCSGAFVQSGSNDAAPAYVLTTGRCAFGLLNVASYQLQHAHEVILSRQVIDRNAVQFERHEQPKAEKRHFVERVAYASMKGKDVALLELAATVGELRARGLVPLPIADEAPQRGDDIEIVGIPSEHDGGDYPDDLLRRARCKEERRTSVVESRWYWADMHASRCHGLGEGAAGAPALDAKGRIFGVYGTRFRKKNAPSTCFQDAPCEVGEGKSGRAVDATAYTSDVTGLGSCFDEDGKLNVQRASCPLDRGEQAKVEQVAESLVLAPRHGQKVNTWGVVVSSPTLTHYRYKVGLLASLDCRSEQGYSAPVPLAAQRAAREPLPERDGLYGMCLVASAEGSAQPLAMPTVVVQHVRAVRPPLGGLQPKNLTPAEVVDIGQAVITQYEAHARAHRAEFSLSYDPSELTRIDITKGRRWRITVAPDAFHEDLTPPDVWALIACHEVGHALGGYPFKRDVTQRTQSKNLAEYGTVSSAEGQSDYFASKECLPRLWQADLLQNARARATVAPFEKTKCDAAWPDTRARDLCYRITQAIKEYAAWLRLQERPALDTPDPVEVPSTAFSTYPRSGQCRVDTLFQGALCATKARGTSIPGLIPPYERVVEIDPEVERAAEPDACLEGPGARPRCWFKRNSVDFDCTDFGETSTRCAMVDGKPAIQTCSRQGGIETSPCPEQTACIQEEGEFAWCR